MKHLKNYCNLHRRAQHDVLLYIHANKGTNQLLLSNLIAILLAV